MSSFTPFTDSETKKVVNILYNRLCDSRFYELHRENIRGKCNYDKLYEMFKEFIESVNYDTELLIRFKESYDYLMKETIGHMYIDHETYLKWEVDNKKMRDDAAELMAAVMANIYKKMKMNL